MSALLTGRVWGYIFQSRAEMDVVFALADHGHDDGTSIYPSVLNIAWKAVLSVRQVQRILCALEDRGIIKAVANPEGGRGNKIEWELHLENATPKPPFERGNDDCLQGVTFQKKGDILQIDDDSESLKGDIFDGKRVTFSRSKKRKGDISQLKGDIFDGKRGNGARRGKGSTTPNHRTLDQIDQPSSIEPLFSEEIISNATDSEWDLPKHALITPLEENFLLSPEPLSTPAANQSTDDTTKGKKLLAEDSPAVKLALLLRKKILDRKSDTTGLPPDKWDDKKLQSWAHEMDLMLRIAGRDHVIAAKLIIAAQADPVHNGFSWAHVIKSPAKLRLHFDTLEERLLDKPVPNVTTNSNNGANMHGGGSTNGYAKRQSGIGQAPRGPNAYANDRNDIIPAPRARPATNT